MSIREQMADGSLFKKETQIDFVAYEFEVPEDNYFILKDKERKARFEKSQRARQHRAEIRKIKNNRHSRGYSAS